MTGHDVRDGDVLVDAKGRWRVLETDGVVAHLRRDCGTASSLPVAEIERMIRAGSVARWRVHAGGCA